jgi:hypothetical protein
MTVIVAVNYVLAVVEFCAFGILCASYAEDVFSRKEKLLWLVVLPVAGTANLALAIKFTVSGGAP